MLFTKSSNGFKETNWQERKINLNKFTRTKNKTSTKRQKKFLLQANRNKKKTAQKHITENNEGLKKYIIRIDNQKQLKNIE